MYIVIGFQQHAHPDLSDDLQSSNRYICQDPSQLQPISLHCPDDSRPARAASCGYGKRFYRPDLRSANVLIRSDRMEQIFIRYLSKAGTVSASRRSYLLSHRSGYPIFSGHHAQPFDMIRMFMCDQDPLQISSGFQVKISCSPSSILFLLIPVSTSTCSMIRAHINAVSAASACYTTKISCSFNPSVHLFKCIFYKIAAVVNHKLTDFPEIRCLLLSLSKCSVYFLIAITAALFHKTFATLSPSSV